MINSHNEAIEIPSFQERRRWFDAYYAAFNVGIPYAPEYGVRYTCPCCGYPTIYTRRGDDICCLCDWQDDGQDDPHADAVWGGPNKEYSLSQARENYERYGIMYGHEHPRLFVGDTEERLTAKQTVINALIHMMRADIADTRRRWEEVDRRITALCRIPRRTV